jgi:hypothetical protein
MEPEQSDKASEGNCSACLANSQLAKVPRTVYVLVVLFSLVALGCQTPFVFAAVASPLIMIILFLPTALFTIAACYGLNQMLLGERAWVFYTVDYLGKPCPRIHIHARAPILAWADTLTRMQRWVTPLTGSRDMGYLARIAQGQHLADIGIVDGPYFELATGL